MIAAEAALTGWVPYRIRSDGPPRVEWCYVGQDTFRDPFFEQTIERCMARPFNQLFAHSTPIETLIDWSAARPGADPAAFIFHSSRCGSTLFAQLAAALPGTIVISEAPPVDHILRATAPEADRIAWLQALLRAFGQPRRGGERNLVVKFDAWHIMHLALIQRAFPGVPSVFLYREPVEVIGSQLRMPGVHMVPGMLDPALFGLDLAGVLRLGREGYIARVLKLVYDAALTEAAAGRVKLMNYAELPEAAVRHLLAWCALRETEGIRADLDRVASLDAKTPSLPFDTTSRATTPAALEAAERLLRTPYIRLESLRLEQ